MKYLYYLVIFFLYKFKFFRAKFYFSSKIRNSSFSKNVIISSGCEIVNSNIGEFSYISANTKIINTEIGKFCSIASGVKINLPKHPTVNFISTHPFFYSSSYKKFNNINETKFQEFLNVKVGNDVWIGENVVILSGINIGNGSIIAAGSIVTKDVDNYAIVGGAPAKIIRMRFSADEICKLLNDKWWDFELNKLLQNFDKFINKDYYFEKEN